MTEKYLQNSEKLQSRKKRRNLSKSPLFSCLHLNQTLIMVGMVGGVAVGWLLAKGEAF
jgi:hypothetical protein